MQMMANVIMKVLHRVGSKTWDTSAGISRRMARRERLKPKTKSLNASRRWVKRSPNIEGAVDMLQQYQRLRWRQDQTDQGRRWRKIGREALSERDRQKKELASRVERLTNSKVIMSAAVAAANRRLRSRRR